VSTDRFTNLEAAGAALAIEVTGHFAKFFPEVTPMVLAVIPNGVPVALPVARSLSLQALALEVHRFEEGVEIVDLPDVQGQVVIVIDDGVETGTVARAVVGPIRDAGAAHVILAVPVCSRELLAQLDLMYDHVIALAKPMARRSLSWHFEDFNTIDERTARDLLA
jgi:predicted phosphoribosyltransferase